MSIAAATLLAFAGDATAHTRLSDKDLEKLIENLKKEAKKFAEPFKQDLAKSAIRRTSEEKAARQVAEQFAKRADRLLDQFHDKKRADTTLPALFESYGQLKNFMKEVAPSEKTQASWSRLAGAMEQLGTAFNYHPPG